MITATWLLSRAEKKAWPPQPQTENHLKICGASATQPLLTTSPIKCPCTLQYAIIEDLPRTWDVFFTQEHSYRQWRMANYNGDPPQVIEQLSIRRHPWQSNALRNLSFSSRQVRLNGTFRLSIRTNTNQKLCLTGQLQGRSGTSNILKAVETSMETAHSTPTRYTGEQVKRTIEPRPGLGMFDDTRNVNIFPWMVLISHMGKAMCSGAIVSDDGYVVTSASCGVQSAPTEYVVSLRELQGKSWIRFDVKQVYKHPQFLTGLTFGKHYENDVAVIKLGDFDKHTVKIATINLNQNVSIPTVGDTTTVLGYNVSKTSNVTSNQGGNNSTIPFLKRTDITVLLAEICSEAYGVTNKTTQLCAGKEGKECSTVCHANQGGGLRAVHETEEGKWEASLIGIVSYSSGCSRDGCRSIYTRVSSIAEWAINTILQDRTSEHKDFWSNPVAVIAAFGAPLLVLTVACAGLLWWSWWRRKASRRSSQQPQNHSESDVPSECGISL